MTPSETFTSFKDLQDLTQATDAQVADMLAFGCTLGVAGNFEDVMTEHLLRLFRHITGVPWVRGWEQGARPDQQYGTIWLYGTKPEGSQEIEYRDVVNAATNELLDDLCEVSYQTFTYQFQLDVYRDSGLRHADQSGPAVTGPRLSAHDVILKLIASFGHPRFRRALAEQCLYLGFPPFGPTRNYAKELVQNTFESRAGVDFYVKARTLSSLRSPTFGDVDWGFVCPDPAAMFPAPPEPTIC